MAIIGYVDTSDRFSESTLSTSETFKIFSEVNKPAEKAISLISSGKELTSEDILPAYIQIKQTSNLLSKAALRAYDVGSTVLMYNGGKDRMSNAFPFMTFKRQGKYKTYVFMDKWIEVMKDGSYRLNSAILHDLLVGALIATKLKDDYNKLKGNDYLKATLMNVYTEFVFRIINREYSIGADKVVNEYVRYTIKRFFLERIFETSDTISNINKLAFDKMKYLDEMKMSGISVKYDEANPTNISDLLRLMSTFSTRMQTLNFKLFVSKWINYFHETSFLAIDNVEYLIFMIASTINGTGIVSLSASDIVKEIRGIKSFNENLMTLI